MDDSIEHLIEQLLAAANKVERRALLEARKNTFSPLALISALKDRSAAHLRDDPTRAQKIVTLAGTVADWSGDAECRALAAWAVANARYFQGHHAECLALYEEALAFYEGANLLQEAALLRLNCGAVCGQIAQYGQALEHLEMARTAFSPDDRDNLISVEMNSADIYRQMDRYADALAACERGRAYALALGDAVQMARLDINRALALEGLGRYAEAIETLQTSHRVLEDASEQLESARALLNLGWLRLHIGHYRRALIDLDAARRGFTRAENEMEVAIVDLQRAEIYLRLNLLPEAIQLCGSARDVLLRERNVARYIALADYFVGVAYSRLPDEEQSAQAALTRAGAQMTQLGSPVQAALIDLARATLLLGQGTAEQWAEAEALAQAAARLFVAEELAAKSARARTVLADAQRALGKLAEASAGYQQALEYLGDGGDGEYIYRAWYGLGKVAEENGQSAQAQSFYGKAVDAVGSLVEALDENELYAGFLHDKQDVFQAAVALHLQEKRLGAAQIDGAISLLEQSRRRVWRLPADRPTETGEDSTHSYLLDEVKRLRRAWHWQQSRAQGDLEIEALPAQSDAETQSRRLLQETKQQLTQAVRSLRLYTGRQQAEPATVSPLGLAEELAEGHSLLIYAVARGQITAFVVSRAGTSAVKLSASWRAVCRHLERLNFSLEWRDDDAYNHLGWLWQALVKPVSDHLAASERLTIVPHSRLYHLPFHALYDGARHLSERYRIDYLPTTGLAIGRSARAEAVTTGGALILSNSHQNRLPGVLAEARTVRDTLVSASTGGWNTRLFQESEASAGQLLQHAPECHLLHIAAHGSFRHDNPLFSALHLGDGPLLLADLDALRLPQRPLVVLSACETGVGDSQGADILGISQAFLRAGAGALLVSLWQVPDAATARLMPHFYRHLTTGASPLDALHRAQAALMADPQHSHPTDWAGWMLVMPP